MHVFKDGFNNSLFNYNNSMRLFASILQAETLPDYVTDRPGAELGPLNKNPLRATGLSGRFNREIAYSLQYAEEA